MLPPSLLSIQQQEDEKASSAAVAAAASTLTPVIVTVHNALHRGCLSYAQTWAWQHVLLSQRLEEERRCRQKRSNHQGMVEHRRHDDDENHHGHNNGDCLLILEHAPVYTLGRGADENHLAFLNDDNDHSHKIDDIDERSDIDVETGTAAAARIRERERLSRKARGPGTARLSLDRHVEEQLRIKTTTTIQDTIDELLAQLAVHPVHAPNGAPVYRVERGGEVTFHGPSQLVVYPLFDLRRQPFQEDLHWYLRTLEQVVIDTLGHYDIEGRRDEINTGVWVDQYKLAAVGIAASRWITHHGFALNVDPDLSYFDTSIILPCGIEGRGVTSMAQILRARGQPVPCLAEVAKVMVDQMERNFGIETVEALAFTSKCLGT